MTQRKVLILCTGNSCRSQMAEAIVNSLIGNEWLAFSAGTQPAGYVHPMVRQVLAEVKINHQGRSKSLEEFRYDEFDLVVTVCDSAAEECPLWLGKGRRVHLGFTDPSKVSGDDQTVLAAFRNVRDDISKRLIPLLRSS